MSASLGDRAHSAFYVLSQRLVGADIARKMCIEELAPRPGDRILDIGCGPAYYLDALPRCDYHGFDTDARRIAAAEERFGDKGHFYAEPYGEKHAARLAPFDGVLLLGLLHHLDDDNAESLLDLIARSVKPEGRVIALETALYEGQSPIARLIAKNDRGDFIRSPKGFQRLVLRSFERVEERFLGDTPRMLSSFYMMIISGPKVAKPA